MSIYNIALCILLFRICLQKKHRLIMIKVSIIMAWVWALHQWWSHSQMYFLSTNHFEMRREKAQFTSQRYLSYNLQNVLLWLLSLVLPRTLQLRNGPSNWIVEFQLTDWKSLLFNPILSATYSSLVYNEMSKSHSFMLLSRTEEFIKQLTKYGVICGYVSFQNPPPPFH